MADMEVSDSEVASEGAADHEGGVGHHALRRSVIHYFIYGAALAVSLASMVVFTEPDIVADSVGAILRLLRE
jgi:hypothetical protein